MTKTFKKIEKNRKMRVSKTGSAKQAIGKIEKNMDTFILTYGQFSLIDAIVTIIDQTGPAHLIISTWTAATAHLDLSAELMATADILSLRMIVDRSFKARQPNYYNKMITLFGANCIREINTHAKFIVIKNNKWNIVVRTSMNLNENPRLENLEISENKNFVEFFEKLTDSIFDETQEGEANSKLPKLLDIKEDGLFKNVKANYIKRSNLNEPKTTHQIRNTKMGKKTN